jgi:NO-binding membrane sensor protein with MHYT domain
MDMLKTTMLMATIAVLVSFLGFVRVTSTTLSFSKRATFIFVGGSVIGFGIWASITLVFMPQIVALNDNFFVGASLAICLATGAFIGELLGKSRKVQERLFPQNL